MEDEMSFMKISAPVAICLLAGLLSVGPITKVGAQTVTPEETRAIAKDAYIFAYPLAMQYHTAYIQAVDENAKEYVGGFGKYRHYGMSTPDNKDIVTPNNDTPYSWAQLDLRAEPWVLTLPKTDGRYLTTEWMDLWHFVLDNPGALRDGDAGGNYLLVSPRWQGTAPAGIKRVIRGESDFIGTLTRTGVSGPDDVPNLEKTQQGIKLQPLSAFLGQPAPSPAPALDFPAWVQGVENTPNIFRYVNFMLPFTVPHPMDKPTLDRIAKIGIAPGKTWDLAAMDPELRKAIENGVTDGQKAIAENVQKTVDSSKLFYTRETFNGDYLNRTTGVVMGQWGNLPEQAVYQTWAADADGQPLDTSKNNYTVTFAPGGLPQAKYFWSITMYNLPERLLVPNSLKRYSIGSQTPGLKTAADGSVTIYIQKDSPGPDKEFNWLPAPNAPFFAVQRVYGPGEAERAGKWRAPAIVRAN
ncbi:MAG: DUF1254 domain-containing protein [Mesorhizobium sp.]|nr:MAG: DUF1254 domain-containing protein [Mesorhizobium sp.]